MRALVAVALLLSFTALASDTPKKASLVPEPSPAPLVKGEPGPAPDAEPGANPGWYKWVGLGAGVTVTTVVVVVLVAVLSRHEQPLPGPRDQPAF